MSLTDKYLNKWVEIDNPNSNFNGNTEFGFNCTCAFVQNNPGNKHFSCEYHGIFTAAKPICNSCEEYSDNDG